MKLPRQPAAVVFDMDGLLFDTEALYGKAILSAAQEVGCAMGHEVFLQLIGRSREVNHRFLLDHYGADYPLDALITSWGRHLQMLAGASPPLNSARTATAEATQLYLRYDGQIGSGTDNHALNVGVRFSW